MRTGNSHVSGEVFFRVAISHDDAIFNPDRPLTAMIVAETILCRQAAHCTGMIVNGHNPSAELCRDIWGNVLSRENFRIGKTNAPPTPPVRDSPTTVVACPIHTQWMIWADSDLEIVVGLAPAHCAYPRRQVNFGQVIWSWKNHGLIKHMLAGHVVGNMAFDGCVTRYPVARNAPNFALGIAE